MEEQRSDIKEMPVSELFALEKMFSEGDAPEPAGRSLEEEVLLACAEQDLRLYEVAFEIGGERQGGWLFGDGDRLLLGVVLVKEEEASFSRKVMYYPEKDMASGNLLPLVYQIKLRLNAKRGKLPGWTDVLCPDWLDELRPIPVELSEKMEQARLLRPEAGSGAWEPSPLGARYGIVRGFRFLDGQGACRTFFAAEEPLNELKDLLAGSQGVQESRKVIPMAERLARLAMGVPGNDAYAVELIKRLGDMPLEQYMGQCPDKLEQLRRELPGGPANTVGEAAVQISRVCHAPGCSAEQCKNLIWLLLVVPMINGMQKFRKFERGT